MKVVSLTLTDFPVERLGALAAFLAGSTSLASVSPGPMPSSAPAADDESGDQPAAAGTLDANGLPHDPRIHSEKPTLTTKNLWRTRRGVSPALIASVEAELRARTPQPVQQPAPVYTAPQPAPMPSPMPMQPAPVYQQQQPAPMPMPVQQQQPAPMPMPVQQQPAPVQQPAPTGALDFNGFMQHLSGQMAKRDANGAPLVEAQYLANVTAEVAGALQIQLNAITDIAPNPQAIDYAMRVMMRDGRW